MQRKQPNPRDQTTNPTTDEEPDSHSVVSKNEALHIPNARRATYRSEVLYIRSYDHQWAYDLDVEIMTEDGVTVFQERYYLLPGHIESESNVVPDGDYQLRVTLDNSYSETLDCRIDSSPDHTAVIEVGNGALALTEGL